MLMAKIKVDTLAHGPWTWHSKNHNLKDNDQIRERKD